VYAGPSLESIRAIVAAHFQVKDAFLDPYGVPTIQIAAEPPRKKFKALLEDLGKQGLLGLLRGSGDTLTIKVVQKHQIGRSRKQINLVMFVATIATVLLAGWYIWTMDPATKIVAPASNPIVEAGVFTGGLLGIIGLHEFGHKAAARHHKLDASLPYFIPGPPPIGTFGALISLRAPPANRDELFDLGLSGPVVGFSVTILVAVLSILLGFQLSAGQVDALQASGITGKAVDINSLGAQPLLLIIISGFTRSLRPGLSGVFVFDSQLFFAAQIGALLTFLNLIPAWQLDGGHISRATFGAEGHRVATIIGIMFLIFAGFYFSMGFFTFAFFLIVFMGLSRRGLAGVEPLDDVSPISNSRKILYVVAMAMLVLTFYAV
jgi:membrane-associated protease RseP (regulator of RpoE activity)